MQCLIFDVGDGFEGGRLCIFGGSCWARRISNLVVGQLVFRGRNSCCFEKHRFALFVAP